MEKPTVLNLTTGGEMLVYHESEIADALARMATRWEQPAAAFHFVGEFYGVCVAHRVEAVKAHKFSIIWN